MSQSASSSSDSPLKRFFRPVIQWFDADYFPGGIEAARLQPDRVDWMRTLPFIVLHLGCLGVIWTGWSWTAVAVAAALYFIRMFAVTGIYHRYFSHKTYSTSRFGQFLLALLGNTAVQRGALWWAYHHRHHHKHSDDEHDAHSPRQHGFIWAHIGWITSKKNFPTDYSTIRDLTKYPELVFLNRFDSIVPILFAVSIYWTGVALETYMPHLGVTGGQLLVWGFFISTIFLFHGTACINSLAHVFGKKRFNTEDDSRNSFILAMITLGEGWHNNHHRYQSATRQGFYWWEIDITYYILKGLSYTGFIWGLKSVPQSIYEEAKEIAHSHSVEAADAARHTTSRDLATLRKVVPTAAAIAIATVPAGAAVATKKPESALHKDVAALDISDQQQAPTKNEEPKS